MREIKFRAFVQCRATYNCYYSDPLFPHIFWENVYKGIFDRGPNQYIGIKDKKDKEIYENDIVKFQFINTQYKVGTISYIENRLSYFIRICDSIYSMIDRETQEVRDIEVIGNIYENPELLEGEKND